VHRGVAHTSTVPTSGNGNLSIGPHTIIRDLVSSLYNSFNQMAMNFGFTIPQALLFIGALIVLLMLWSIYSGIRNRTSFSLEDEPDTPASDRTGVSG